MFVIILVWILDTIAFLTTKNIFEDTWKNRAEQESKAQAYDEEMIREAKRSEVEEEIRRQVDVLMREELDLLKIVSNKYWYTATNKDCIILDFIIHKLISIHYCFVGSWTWQGQEGKN